MSLFKEKVHQQCLELALGKRDEISEAIDRVQESLSAEGKSTAGDKHETGRAMLQLEREKLGLQLKNAEAICTILQKIRPTLIHKTIALGSFVKTDAMNFYLSVSMGQYRVDKQTVFAISPQSPIGKLLLGKTINETVSFNGKTQTILKVT